MGEGEHDEPVEDDARNKQSTLEQVTTLVFSGGIAPLFLFKYMSIYTRYSSLQTTIFAMSNPLCQLLFGQLRRVDVVVSLSQ